MATHLSISGLSKAFGQKSVLRDVNVEVQPGEFITIVGKSGSGKSTLLRLIAGLEEPTQGRIQINAQVLAGQNQVARVMFQDARLLPWKRVIDNVTLGLKGGQTPGLKALEQVGLLDRAHEWPAILSGGEKQRVALARALVTQPPLLLLDEPLGALDALTRIEMQQLLERLWREQGFTAVLITHDVDEAIALGDRVMLIEDGHIGLDESVDLSRPRHRGSALFGEIKERILNRILGNPARLPLPIPDEVEYPLVDNLAQKALQLQERF